MRGLRGRPCCSDAPSAARREACCSRANEPGSRGESQDASYTGLVDVPAAQRAIGGAGPDRPASSADELSRPAAEVRFGVGSSWAFSYSYRSSSSRSRSGPDGGGPLERRPVRRRDRAAAVRRRVRAGRAAVPRRLRLGRQPPGRALGGRGAPRRGARSPPARDPERVRAPGERVPAGRLLDYIDGAALPRRLRSRRRRGDRPAGGGVHAGDRRSPRARRTAFASTTPS